MIARRHIRTFSYLFVSACLLLGGACNLQELRDPLDNRIGQIDAPPELRE